MEGSGGWQKPQILIFMCYVNISPLFLLNFLPKISYLLSSLISFPLLFLFALLLSHAYIFLTVQASVQCYCSYVLNR